MKLVVKGATYELPVFSDRPDYFDDFANMLNAISGQGVVVSGADPTGVADSTDAIERACELALSLPSGSWETGGDDYFVYPTRHPRTVVLPPGLYRTTRPIPIRYRGVCIVGMDDCGPTEPSEGAKTIIYGDHNGHIFAVDAHYNVNGFFLKNLSLKKRNAFVGNGNGINVAGENYVFGLRFQHLQVLACDRGFKMVCQDATDGTGSMAALVFDNCQLGANYGYGIELRGHAAIGGIWNESSIVQNGLGGVLMGAKGFHIMDTDFEGQINPVAITNGSSSEAVTVGPGNYFEGNADAGLGMPGLIQFALCTDFREFGNQYSGADVVPRVYASSCGDGEIEQPAHLVNTWNVVSRDGPIIPTAGSGITGLSYAWNANRPNMPRGGDLTLNALNDRGGNGDFFRIRNDRVVDGTLIQTGGLGYRTLINGFTHVSDGDYVYFAFSVNYSVDKPIAPLVQVLGDIGSGVDVQKSIGFYVDPSEAQIGDTLNFVCGFKNDSGHDMTSISVYVSPYNSGSTTYLGAYLTHVLQWQGTGAGGNVLPNIDPLAMMASYPITYGVGAAEAVNIKDWGAKGDGSTDDSAAVTAAIAAAVANGMRHIFFPPCAVSYRLDGSALSPNAAKFIVPSNFKVSGCPAGPIYMTGASTLSVGEMGYYNDWVLFRGAVGCHDIHYQDLWFIGENGAEDGTGFLKIEQSNNAAIEFEASTLGDNTRDCSIRFCHFRNLNGFSAHNGGVMRRVHYCDNEMRYCGNGVNLNAYDSLMTRNTFFECEGFENAGSNYQIVNNNFRNVWGAAISMGGESTPGFVLRGGLAQGNVIDTVHDGQGIFASDAMCDSLITGNFIARTYDFGINTDTSGAIMGAVNYNNSIINNRIVSAGADDPTAYAGIATYVLGQLCTSDGGTHICLQGGTGGASGPTGTAYSTTGSTKWKYLNAGAGSLNRAGIKAGGSAEGGHIIHNNHITDDGLAGYAMSAAIYTGAADIVITSNKCKTINSNPAIILASPTHVYISGNTKLNSGIIYNTLAGTTFLADLRDGRDDTDKMFGTHRYDEAYNRYELPLSGLQAWGDGGNPVDVAFGRLGAGVVGTPAASTLSAGGGTDASAILQGASTTQGFLPPRMTTTQRNLIASPAAGLMIFNTTTTKLETWDGAVWQAAW